MDAPCLIYQRIQEPVAVRLHLYCPFGTHSIASTTPTALGIIRIKDWYLPLQQLLNPQH